MSTVGKVLEVDCTTGEETLRDMTAEEVARENERAAYFAELKAAQAAADEAKAAAAASAAAKLAKLGLTADEIAALQS